MLCQKPEIQQATNNDKTMKGLRASIRLNQWDNDIGTPYKQNIIL